MMQWHVGFLLCDEKHLGDKNRDLGLLAKIIFGQLYDGGKYADDKKTGVRKRVDLSDTLSGTKIHES